MTHRSLLSGISNWFLPKRDVLLMKFTIVTYTAVRSVGPWRLMSLLFNCTSIHFDVSVAWFGFWARILIYQWDMLDLFLHLRLNQVQSWQCWSCWRFRWLVRCLGSFALQWSLFIWRRWSGNILCCLAVTVSCSKRLVVFSNGLPLSELQLLLVIYIHKGTQVVNIGHELIVESIHLVPFYASSLLGQLRTLQPNCSFALTQVC